ncbi:MAG: glycosyltransferase family 39 protein [Chloroflexota bacterium]
MLVFIGITAVFFRFYQLGEIPSGLFRDEAYNGLDAVRVLAGEHAIIFPANNGREPLYIYLTALAVALFGQTAVAVRIAAAVVGSLTTWAVYKLADEWFGRFVGLTTAWLWAVTFWPVHLSRIGLRAILLVPLLTLTFWFLTRGYREKRPLFWMLAGAMYGLSFYTYLAARVTPILLLMFFVAEARMPRLVKQQGEARMPRLRLIFYFVATTAVFLLPLIWLIIQQPDLLLGRTDQVSILNPQVNGGNLWLTLWRKGWQAVGMFFWQGDGIVRHNALLSYPAGNGRPVFDLFLTIPFLLGVWYCLGHWRQRAALFTLPWIFVMLAPTVLAEDTPHFLRAVGILPAALMLPALGLKQIWQWRGNTGRVIVGILLAGSLGLTIRDGLNYGQQPTVAHLFEDGARTLAEEAREQASETAVYIDNHFRNETAGWPSIPFLLADAPINWYDNAAGVPPDTPLPVTIYVWPYAPHDFVATLASSAAHVQVQTGALGRGDFEETAYPLYLVYTFAAQADALETATPIYFDKKYLLRDAILTEQANGVTVDLTWGLGEEETAVSPNLVAFVHVIGPDGLIAQFDSPPGQNLWRLDWWHPDLVVSEQREVSFTELLDPAQNQVFVGLYDNQTLERVPIVTRDGDFIGDQWQIWP